MPRAMPKAGSRITCAPPFAQGLNEAATVEALSYVIWPCGVNAFLSVCETWHGLMQSGALTPSARFGIWAAWRPLTGAAATVWADFRQHDGVNDRPSEKLVRDYLLAVEKRDLPRAYAMLAEDFVMVFPGGVRMTSLRAVLDWAAPRYRFVKKTFDSFDHAGSAAFSSGTLHGEWPDGTPFSGIRFIDRFQIVEGKLTRPDVWNDMAELRPR